MLLGLFLFKSTDLSPCVHADSQPVPISKWLRYRTFTGCWIPVVVSLSDPWTFTKHLQQLFHSVPTLWLGPAYAGWQQAAPLMPGLVYSNRITQKWLLLSIIKTALVTAIHVSFSETDHCGWLMRCLVIWCICRFQILEVGLAFWFLLVWTPEATSVVWGLVKHAGTHSQLFSSAVKIHLHPSAAFSPSSWQPWLDLTSACWWLLAPLATGLALSCGGSFQSVAFVAGEAHNVVVVEAIACGAAIDRATGVATGDSWDDAHYQQGMRWRGDGDGGWKMKGSNDRSQREK